MKSRVFFDDKIYIQNNGYDDFPVGIGLIQFYL